MKTWQRGLAIGAGFGLAVAISESWLMSARFVQMNLPPIWLPMVRNAVIEVVLCGLLGLASSPLLRLRFGWLVLLGGVGLLWAALGLVSSPESDFLFMLVVGPPVFGGVLTLVGLWIARHRPGIPFALGLALLLAAFAFNAVRSAMLSMDQPDMTARVAAPAGAPDVVLIVLDTVRARNVSAYGYERDTTPNFDALAAEGALFLEATSPSNWSLPSHASLFTGLFPSGHGAHGENYYLREDVPTLAGTLAKAGWESVCFTANPWISEALGTARGFDWSDESWRSGGAGALMNSTSRLLDYLGIRADEDKGGSKVASNFDEWLVARPADARPYFVFLNFMEAHFPYHQLPDDYLTRYGSHDPRELRDLSMTLLADQFGSSALDPETAVEAATDMYDGGIRYADWLLGRIADAIRRRGTLDSTIFVVLADHGELLGEHTAFGHGRSLYEDETHVPLLVRHPPRIAAGTRVWAEVSTVGVKATILDLAGVEPQARLHVGSLLPLLEGRAAGGPVFSERQRRRPRGEDESTGAPLRSDMRQRTYRVRGMKLMQSDDELRVFDLREDPGELHDLHQRSPAELARLRDELETWRAHLDLPNVGAAAQGDVVAEPDLDEAAEERLRALGYIE